MKENTLLFIIVFVIVLMIIGAVLYVKNKSKQTKDNYSEPVVKTKENFNPPVVSNANLLYTDSNGNLGATSDVGINYLTVSNTLNAGTIQQGGNTLIPAGIVLMWYGTSNTIPAGWVLCDGNYNTPDLRGKFVVGVGSNGTNTYSLNDSAGNDSVTLGKNNLPSHNHSINDPGHTHQYYSFEPNTGRIADSGSDISAKDNNTGTLYVSKNSTTGITIESTGEGQAIDIRPRYYALCYIMKT